MLQTKAEEEIKIHILFSVTFYPSIVPSVR